MMGQLPQERLKPAPAWSSTSLDYFGPFEIRGETNKRSEGKAYGVNTEYCLHVCYVGLCISILLQITVQMGS